MEILYNKNTNPYFNIAFDEYALTTLKREVLLLWQNSPAIIVGKNQNTIEEINTDYVNENDIKVVRRVTGGGAVYHDIGNINFTFISPNKKNDFDNYKKFTLPVIDFLATLGVKASLKGRNDLLINGKKFSGNAQAVKDGWIMHHGTLLFDTDFTVLSKALSPNKVKIESKGIKSVNSRVTNISSHLKKPMETGEFISLFYNFLRDNNNAVPMELTEQEKNAINELADEKFFTWEWNYGSSPKYNYSYENKFSTGLVQVRLQVEKGIITEAKIYGDFFGKSDITELESHIVGATHSKEVIAEKIKNINVSEYISGILNEDFLTLF